METSKEVEFSKAETPKFPFLGALENGEVFEYLLISIDTDVAEIALLKWFINRIKLNIGDKIELFLPESLVTKYRLRDNLSGTVAAAKHKEEVGGEVYQLSLSKQESDSVHQQSFFDRLTQQTTQSLTDLLIHFIKDSMMLKAGIHVYFKHLIPYFSRIGNYSHQDYDKLKTYFLHDIKMHIISNEAKLEKLYQTAKQKITKLEEIPIHLDLETLREILESEISLSVFNVIFSEEQKVSDQELTLVTHPQYGIFMYINAIKNLEKRLYSNYNNIVILYLKSLSS